MFCRVYIEPAISRRRSEFNGITLSLKKLGYDLLEFPWRNRPQQIRIGLKARHQFLVDRCGGNDNSLGNNNSLSVWFASGLEDWMVVKILEREKKLPKRYKAISNRVVCRSSQKGVALALL